MIAISRTGRVLRRLVRLSCRRPAVTVAISLLLAAAAVAYTAHALTFKTSTRALLPQDAGYVVRYAEYAKEFGELEDIVVVVEAGSFEGARAYAARLTEELKQAPVKFQRVAYRIDPKRFEGRQLLYLTTPELREIRDKIFDHQEFMESFAGDPSLARLLEGVNTQMAAAFVSNLFDIGLQDKDLPVDTRFLRVLLDQMASRLERPAPYRSPWGTLFSFGEDPPDDAGYFLSEDKSLLFILVETPPSEKGSFMGDQAAIETIREAVARLRPAFPNVQAGVTGAPALSNDEMTAAFHDSSISDVLAFALTLLVMTLAFMRVGKPLLMLGVLAVTLAWSMGVVTLTVGHLTLFSVMFISIVVGIGIDYGIYYLFRYEEEIFLGRNLREALEHTAARTGPGMLAGALTAAGTFFVLMLTDFRGIQELGFIAGIAILIAWVGMMTLFPAILVFVDRHHADRPRGQRPRAHQLERIRVPLLDRLVTYPRTVLIGAGLLTAFSIWAVPRVGFDYNVLNLQAKGTESVAWERRILASTGRSGFNAIVLRLVSGGAAGQAGGLREAAVGLRHRFGPARDPGRPGREDRPDQELRAPGGPDPRRPLEPGGPRPAQAGARRHQAALRRGRGRGGGQAPRGDPGGPRQDDRGAAPAHAQQPRLGGGGAELPAGPALPGLREQVLQPAAQPQPHLGDHQGRAGRAPAQVHRRERPLPHPDPSQGGHLGEGGRGPVRAGPAHGGSRRHRPAHHHLRGDRADGARLPHREPVRLRPGRRPQHPHDPPHAREPARPRADGAGRPVDRRV